MVEDCEDVEGGFEDIFQFSAVGEESSLGYLSPVRVLCLCRGQPRIFPVCGWFFVSRGKRTKRIYSTAGTKP